MRLERVTGQTDHMLTLNSVQRESGGVWSRCMNIFSRLVLTSALRGAEGALGGGREMC